MPKLEYDVIVKDGGVKALTKAITEQNNEVTRLIATFGKESKEAQTASKRLGELREQKRQLTKEVANLGGGVKKTSAQLLEMGENITVVVAGIKSVLGGFGALVKESAVLSAEFSVLRANFQGTEQDLELFRKATAGTVSDANLIKLSNQAGDLGISLDKQALLFSLAEDAADKYGGTVEENFSKVVMATEGNIRGLKSLGIQKEVYNKTVSDLVKSMGGEVEMLQGVNGEQEINIKKLDPAIQKQIRLEAILKLTGVTLDSVGKKTQDQKDKIEALSVRVEEAKRTFGDFVMKGVEPVITSFLDLGKTGNIVVGGVSQIAGALTGILPVLASVKMAWNVSFASMASTLGMVSLGIANLVAHFNNLKGLLNIVDTIKGGWKESWFNQNVLGWGLDENSKNETGFAEGIFNAMGMAKNFMRSQTKNIPTVNIPKDKTGSRGSKTAREEQEEKVLTLYQQQLEVVKKIEEAITLNAGDIGAVSDFTKQLLEAKQELTRLGTGLGQVKFGKDITEDYTPDRNLSLRTMQRVITPEMMWQAIDWGELTDRLHSAVSGVSEVFTSLMDSLNIKADSFVGTMVSGFDKILSIINTIVATLNAVSAVKGLLSFIPGGSIIGGLAGGGDAMPMMNGGGITVIVNSEVESTKAIKFLRNNMPKYNSFKADLQI